MVAKSILHHLETMVETYGLLEFTGESNQKPGLLRWGRISSIHRMNERRALDGRKKRRNALSILFHLEMRRPKRNDAN